MSLAHRVASFAPHHTRLLAELRELAESVRVLPDAEELVLDLQAQLVRAEKELKTAQGAERRCRREHEDVKQSLFRKFSYRATGRGAEWAQISSKSDQDYADKIERVHNVQADINALKAALRDAEDNVKSTRADIGRYERVQEDLADMYTHVFSGPTPEAPQHDVLDWAFRTAGAERNRLQAALIRETQALESLRTAEDAVKQCVVKMEECKKASSADIWTNRDSVETIKYSSLSAARSFALEFASRYMQARRTHDEISSAPDIVLPVPSKSDLIFNGLISESMQHQKIVDGLDSAQRAQRAVHLEILRAETRVDHVQDAAAPAEEAYLRARDELMHFRRTLFETLAAQSASAPPGYEQVEAAGPSARRLT